ncbi:hypothetical protein ACCO45_008997 [Purpureocillium lilacinum]|uniref:Uncharacterized protein n=1 Tax=Purpureocillium lilacinum TaxID=33203 RepID=A0ACC4DIQ8_PURLI
MMSSHGEQAPSTIVVIGYRAIAPVASSAIRAFQAQDNTTRLSAARRARMALLNPRCASSALGRLCLDVGWRACPAHPGDDTPAASRGRLAAPRRGRVLTPSRSRAVVRRHKDPGVEYLEAPDQGYRQQTKETFERETGLGGYRKLAPAEVPEGVVLAYDSSCKGEDFGKGSEERVGGLHASQRRNPGRQCQRHRLWRCQVVSDPRSARQFRSHPTQLTGSAGQTVVSNLSHVTKTVTRQNKDGSWSFLIPRFLNGGTIVGGTKEPGDWRTEPDLPTRERLLSAGLTLEPYSHDGPARDAAETARNCRVISDVVGRRPTREGGVRLEVEERPLVKLGNAPAKGRVIHAYGAGGRGYEISWGVASEVADLAIPLLRAETQIKGSCE